MLLQTAIRIYCSARSGDSSLKYRNFRSSVFRIIIPSHTRSSWERQLSDHASYATVKCPWGLKHIVHYLKHTFIFKWIGRCFVSSALQQDQKSTNGLWDWFLNYKKIKIFCTPLQMNQFSISFFVVCGCLKYSWLDNNQKHLQHKLKQEPTCNWF